MTIKHSGVDVEKLPKPELEERICRKRITDTDSPDRRQVSFHVIFKAMRYVITGTFLKKRRLIQPMLKG